MVSLCFERKLKFYSVSVAILDLVLK